VTRVALDLVQDFPTTALQFDDDQDLPTLALERDLHQEKQIGTARGLPFLELLVEFLVQQVKVSDTNIGEEIGEKILGEFGEHPLEQLVMNLGIVALQDDLRVWLTMILPPTFAFSLCGLIIWRGVKSI